MMINKAMGFLVLQALQKRYWAAGLLLLGCARPGLAQPKNPPGTTQTATLSAPLQLPLVASLNMLPQRLSAEDSLDRLVFVRNHVKTMTLLRQRAGRQPDTTEYVEVDPRGNKTLIAKPFFGQHRQQRFDKRNRLVESVLLPTDGFQVRTRLVYDPKTQLHTTYVAVEGAPPVLWQQAQRTKRGDTATTEAIFRPLPAFKQGPTHRLLMREYRRGADTVCVEVIGYDAADQPTDFAAYYRIVKGRQPVEVGALDFGTLSLSSSAGASANPVSAAELLRRSRHLPGRVVPNTRYVYDARGYLVKSTYISDPNARPARPITTKSADGRGSLTLTAENSIAAHLTLYQRTSDGRVQREDQTFELRPGISDPSAQQRFKPTYTEYEYGPKGLLLRKITTQGIMAGRPAEVYEVKYTYY